MYPSDLLGTCSTWFVCFWEQTIVFSTSLHGCPFSASSPISPWVPGGHSKGERRSYYTSQSTNESVLKSSPVICYISHNFLLCLVAAIKDHFTDCLMHCKLIYLLSKALIFQIKVKAVSMPWLDSCSLSVWSLTLKSTNFIDARFEDSFLSPSFLWISKFILSQKCKAAIKVEYNYRKVIRKEYSPWCLYFYLTS